MRNDLANRLTLLLGISQDDVIAAIDGYNAMSQEEFIKVSHSEETFVVCNSCLGVTRSSSVVCEFCGNPI